MKYKNNIKQLRIEKDISVRRLAYMTGIKDTYLRKIESGHNKINSDHAIKLSKALGVKILSNGGRE